MCFNRRRNIFTLGDFHQNTNPISQVRTQFKSRQKTDVFESDPFKVQSYNFRYADRPTVPKTPQFPSCRFRNQFHTFYQQQQQQPQSQNQTQTQAQSQFQTQSTQPELPHSDLLTDTYFYNYDFANTGLDENFAQADQLSNFRGHEDAELRLPLSSANLFCNPSKGSLVNRRQTGTRSQQCQHILPQNCYSSRASHPKLSTYGRTLPQTSTATTPPPATTTASTKSTNTSTTNMSSKIKAHSSLSRELEPTLRYGRNESKKLPPIAAVRARRVGGCSSKAVAAAVGTVGPYSRIPPPASPSAAAATAAIKRLNERPFGGSLTALESNRQGLGSRRFYNTKTNCLSNTSLQRTGRSCSTTVLKERISNHSQQGVQAGTHSQTLQQFLQNISKRNLMNNGAQPPYCPIHNPVPQPAKNFDCQISINIKKLEKQPTDKLVIRIESGGPFKIINNNNNNIIATNTQRTADGLNMRGKRLNNLMSERTIKTPPRSYNIVSKCSTETLDSNTRQSKHSLSDEDNSYNTYTQRKLACERFFERELATKSANRTPAVVVSKERVPARVPWSSADKNKGLTAKSLASQRLQEMYNNKLSSLRQLKASIDAASTMPAATPSRPPSRAPSAESRTSIVDEEVQVSRNSSTTTFTLGKCHSKLALGPTPTLSKHSMTSTCSRNSTFSSKSLLTKPRTSVTRITDAIPKPPMNVNINLFTERSSGLRA